MNDELCRKPVLLNIGVERMAALIASYVPSLNVGSRLLAYRYHHGRHGDPLMTEIPWARKVYESVLNKIEKWPEPHRSMSIESTTGLIRHYEHGHRPEDQIVYAETQPDEEGDQQQNDA
jgi:hypothetical protein